MMTRRRLAASIVIGGFILLGLAGLLSTYEPGYDVDMSQGLQGPSWSHLLGTDRLGRDLLQRLIAGTRSFFMPGLAASLIAVAIGVPLGAAAGYKPASAGVGSPQGAWAALLRSLQGIVSFALAVPGALPRFVTIVLVCVSFGFSPFVIAAVAGVLYAAELGEDLKTRVMECSREEYIEAARADGLPLCRILGVHILWLQCRSLVLRHVVGLWVFVLMTETALSFIQTSDGGMYGVQEPAPSWGNMIVTPTRNLIGGLIGNDAARYVWPALVPSVALLGAGVALTWVGDVLLEPVQAGGSRQDDAE